MNARTLALLALLTLACLPGESSAQFRLPRLPSGGAAAGGGPRFFPVILPLGGSADAWVVVVIVVVVLLVIAACASASQQSPADAATPAGAGRVRVTAVPPGEAPEDVRRAWVGLELPLARSGPQRAAGAV